MNFLGHGLSVGGTEIKELMNKIVAEGDQGPRWHKGAGSFHRVQGVRDSKKVRNKYPVSTFYLGKSLSVSAGCE